MQLNLNDLKHLPIEFQKLANYLTDPKPVNFGYDGESMYFLRLPHVDGYEIRFKFFLPTVNAERLINEIKSK